MNATLLRFSQRFSSSTIPVLSVCLYIVFSLTRRYTDDPRLMLIPILGAVAIVAVLGLKIYDCVAQRQSITSKPNRWMLYYSVLNTALLAVSISIYWMKGQPAN